MSVPSLIRAAIHALRVADSRFGVSRKVSAFLVELAISALLEVLQKMKAEAKAKREGDNTASIASEKEDEELSTVCRTDEMLQRTISALAEERGVSFRDVVDSLNPHLDDDED